MAESTLTLKRDDLRKAVGNMLGQGIDITEWESSFSTRVDMCVDIGSRMVYEPEIIAGETQAHIWSFMHPKMMAFQLNMPYAIGTVTITSGVVTGLGTTFPTWAANGELIVNGVSYSVATRSSGTVLTLDDTTVTASAGSAYTLQQIDYLLPELFGGIRGDLFLNQRTNTLGYVLQRADKETILEWQKSGVSDFAAQPCRYAVFPQEQTGQADQRWLITVWPSPDAPYTLTGFYTVNPYRLTSALPYPMGGLPLSECLREAVLAAAEVEFKGEMGVHNQLFRVRLQTAISYDRQMSNPGNLGQNLDRSNERSHWARIGMKVQHVGLGPTSYIG